MMSSFSYDVFLSFRGEDTRQGFTGNLYNALRDKRIHTFIDDEELQRGNQITPSLLNAIEKSKIAIIVLSKNYASSSFCLDELVHILHCSNNKGTLVLPIFYEVDPSVVRHLKVNYGEELAKHEMKYTVNVERLDKWKIALQQVANLSGWHFKHGVEYEYNIIKSVVREVSNKINRALLHVADFPVRLESPMLQVKSLLYDGLDDGVCMVIHMMSSFSYDVFLSFRGEDTHYGFTGNLYNALYGKGIRTFIDDEELQRGNQIKPSLFNAIEQSKIAIVVLSKNYASSSFCLDELVRILHCSTNKGTLILPVFYEVDPSIVRQLKGNYGEALTKHEKKYTVNVERLDKWKIALQQVANLSGWHFQHGVGYEYNFIKSVVGEVSNKINRTLLHVADFPVGLESQVLQVKSLLYDGLDDEVCVVGIHGIGGIGKTTLARAVCNFVGHQFEGFCFLKDVRKKELVNLQKILLSEIIGENDIQLISVYQGIHILKHRLRHKKLFLVLDDVDYLEQLQVIVGGLDWFGPGSKIIITTRDKHLLTSHGVQRIYEVEELNEKYALEMLRWNAFKIGKVDPIYEDILKRTITYASGLPLALVTIGSNLFGKSIEEWESTLNKYERIPNKKIYDILKVSFDSLKKCQQNLFLDIACCFKGYKLSYVKEIINAHHGGCQEYDIEVLIEKSLLKIDRNGCLKLHDLIEEMGKEIVRQESPEDPGKRSRLWLHDDIIEVLEKNTGTRTIQIITLDVINVNVKVDWDGEAFKEMKNLKTLIIKGGCFSQAPKHLPKSLRVLEWRGYPSYFLPSDFNPKKIVKLKLDHSWLTSTELLNTVSKKNFVNLTALRFDG